MTEQRGHIQLGSADQEIVGQHDAGDRPQQRRITDQPGEDVGAGRLQQLPREDGDADAGGDVAAHAKGDLLRRQIRETVGRGHDVGGEVGRQRGQQQGQQGHHDRRSAHAPGQRHRIPDRFAIDDHRRRGHGDADKSQQGHWQRQSQRLTDDLVALALGIAGEVRNVQRQRGPEADHGRQRGPEHRGKLACAVAAFGKAGGRGQHRPEAIGLHIGPAQQRQTHQDQQGCRQQFQPADRLGAVADEHHVQRPEGQETQGLTQIDAEQRQLVADDGIAGHHIEDRVDRRAADPGLDPEPTTGDQTTQHRRQLGAAGAEAGAQQHRKRDAVFGTGMPDQQHRHQHDQVCQQDGADRLAPAHALADHARRQHVGGHADHHAHPQRGDGLPVPGALIRRAWQQIGIDQIRGTEDLGGCAGADHG